MNREERKLYSGRGPDKKSIRRRRANFFYPFHMRGGRTGSSYEKHESGKCSQHSIGRMPLYQYTTWPQIRPAWAEDSIPIMRKSYPIIPTFSKNPNKIGLLDGR